MHEHSHEGRSALELVEFAAVFYGTVIAAAGVIITSLPVAIFGGGLAGLGLLGFAIGQWLSE